MRNVGSDLKQVHGEAVILAWFSPRSKNGKCLIFCNGLPPTLQWNLAFFRPAKGTQNIILLEQGTVKMQKYCGGAEPEVLLLSSKFPIYIYANSLHSCGEQGCPASQGMKLSCLACSNRSQEMEPQCNVLNYISIPWSPCSTLSLKPGTHRYCRNAHRCPNIQNQHVIFTCLLGGRGGLGSKILKTNKTNKSVSKAFKWMRSHYNWYQSKGMQTGQSVAWCF